MLQYWMLFRLCETNQLLWSNGKLRWNSDIKCKRFCKMQTEIVVSES